MLQSRQRVIIRFVSTLHETHRSSNQCSALSRTMPASCPPKAAAPGSACCSDCCFLRVGSMLSICIHALMWRGVCPYRRQYIGFRVRRASRRGLTRVVEHVLNMVFDPGGPNRVRAEVVCGLVESPRRKRFARISGMAGFDANSRLLFFPGP